MTSFCLVSEAHKIGDRMRVSLMGTIIVSVILGLTLCTSDGRNTISAPKDLPFPVPTIEMGGQTA